MSQRKIGDFFVSRKRPRPDHNISSLKARLVESDAGACRKVFHESSVTGVKDPSPTCSEQVKCKSTLEVPQGAKTESRPGPLPRVLGKKSVQRRLFEDDSQTSDVSSETVPKRRCDPSVPPENKVMSPQKMKETLQSCESVEKLKQKLVSFNKSVEHLKAFRNKSKSEKVDDKSPIVFEITSPQKTPKKCPQTSSPMKTPTKLNKRLVESVSSSLTLPFKYRYLNEVFHCVDTVASFLHNRKEIITFKKLKTSVQQMLRKNFTEHHLGQIKAVFPSAFVFRREKDLPNCRLTPDNKNKWQLTVEVNLNYEEESGEAVGEQRIREFRKLTPSDLLERRKLFQAGLLDVTRQHHQAFLESLDPPQLVQPDRITRWHCEFPLDQVPDIPAAELPPPPVQHTGATAQDVLQRAQRVLGKYPALRECLEAAAAAGPSSAAAQPSPEPPRSQPPAAADTSGLPAGLLQRIRAREALRQQREMTRSPADQQRRQRLARLPRLARSLRALFVSERRNALPLELVTERLSASCGLQLSPAELLRHLELLLTEAPSLVQREQIRSGTYLKLCRDADVNLVVKQLEEVLNKT